MAHLRRGLVALTLTGAFGVVSAGIACSSSSSTPLQPGPGPDAGAEGSTFDSGANTTDTPELMFRGFQAEFVAKCGGANGQCHQNGTFLGAPKWLALPDPYISAKAYPGNIPTSNDPSDSKLLTQVEHEGPALISSPVLFDKVRDWVVAEVKANGVKLPATGAFTIKDGANEVDLSALVGGLAGTKLTFTTMSSNGFLTILNMKITAPFPKGLHIESPFFVIVPANGPTLINTTDGFQGTLDVAQGQTSDFFGGSAILKKWDPAGKLKIVFTKLEAVVAEDGGVLGGCKAAQAFHDNAVPQLTADLGGGVSCLGCHGGGNGAAQFAMDLGKLTTNESAACAQTRNRITPGDAPHSQIILTPTGDPNGDINHGDAGGPAAACAIAPTPPCVNQAFIDGMTVWINAEK